MVATPLEQPVRRPLARVLARPPRGAPARRRLLDAALGALAPGELLAGRGADAAERLAALAEDEEVLLTVLDAAAAGEPPPRAWLRRAAPYAALRERLLAEREALRSELAAAGVAHAVVKGPAVERLYAPGLRRQFEDLDLALPDLDALWLAAAVLERRGHRLAALALGRVGGRLAATAKLARGAAGAQPGTEVKLHAGGFAIRFDALVPFEADLWAGDPAAALAPPPRWQALILLAELHDRRRPFVRDALDAAAIARALDDADRRWLVERACAHSLRRELALVAPQLGPAPVPRRALARAPGREALRTRAARRAAPRALDGCYAALVVCDPDDRGELELRGSGSGALVRTPLGLLRAASVEASPGGAATPAVPEAGA